MMGNGTPEIQTLPVSWRLTPRWMFWRPTWRKRIVTIGDTRLFRRYDWKYQTNRQRAAEVLKEKFG